MLMVGIVAVAERLEQEGCPYFGVAYLEEAFFAKRGGCSDSDFGDGLNIGRANPLYIEHNITLTASS